MASIIIGLSRNFYTRTHVNFTHVNKVEAIYGRSRVSVKVERGSTFTFTRGLSYIASISFMRVKFTCIRTEKLRYSANLFSLSRARRKTQSNKTRERRAQCARPTKGKVTSSRVFRLVFLSFLFCQPGSHAPCRRLFFFFVWHDLEVHSSQPPS